MKHKTIVNIQMDENRLITDTGKYVAAAFKHQIQHPLKKKKIKNISKDLNADSAKALMINENVSTQMYVTKWSST